MTLFDNLITVFVLGTLAAIVYCRIMNKTLFELFVEIKDMFSETREEVIEQ